MLWCCLKWIERMNLFLQYDLKSSPTSKRSIVIPTLYVYCTCRYKATCFHDLIMVKCQIRKWLLLFQWIKRTKYLQYFLYNIYIQKSCIEKKEPLGMTLLCTWWWHHCQCWKGLWEDHWESSPWWWGGLQAPEGKGKHVRVGLSGICRLYSNHVVKKLFTFSQGARFLPLPLPSWYMYLRKNSLRPKGTPQSKGHPSPDTPAASVLSARPGTQVWRPPDRQWHLLPTTCLLSM